MASTLDRTHLLDRRVAAAILLQLVGYAALLAVYPHSEPTAVVEMIATLPTVVLVLLALPAIPATVATVVLGAVLSLLGFDPEALPPLLLARGDLLFFVCAYGVAVASGWANRRSRKRRRRA